VRSPSHGIEGSASPVSAPVISWTWSDTTTHLDSVCSERSMAAPATQPERHTSQQRRAVPRAVRCAGYLLGIAINLALIWLVNSDPGWRWVALLTEDFARVVGLVTASLVVGAVLNLLYIRHDPAWLKRLGDAITAGFAGVIFVRLLVIFPFELSSWSPGWASALRFALGLLTVIMAIAVLASLVQSFQEGVGSDWSPGSDG